jgi:hypothetical protein
MSLGINFSRTSIFFSSLMGFGLSKASPRQIMNITKSVNGTRKNTKGNNQKTENSNDGTKIK